MVFKSFLRQADPFRKKHDHFRKIRCFSKLWTISTGAKILQIEMLQPKYELYNNNKITISIIQELSKIVTSHIIQRVLILIHETGFQSFISCNIALYGV